MTNPIDIYIGCTEHQQLVADVLASSVKRRTQRQVRFFPLYKYEIDFVMPADPENRPGTPFSFARFMIPEIAGFKGRALYMDCDQIVFKDIANLADRKIGPSGVSSCDTRSRKLKKKPTRRSSMMLIDCERAGWQINQIVKDLDAGRYTYNQLFSLEAYDHDIPCRWNSLDFYLWPYTCLLHYTKKQWQPWINNVHKLAYLWLRELFHAIDSGEITQQQVHDTIDQELVRPSLAYQIKHREADVRALPEEEKKRDEPFIQACAEQQFNNVPGEYAPCREDGGD